MQKTKCYLAALVSGVLLVTGILAGYGQSKKNDHLTVYLWGKSFNEKYCTLYP